LVDHLFEGKNAHVMSCTLIRADCQNKDISRTNLIAIKLAYFFFGSAGPTALPGGKIINKLAKKRASRQGSGYLQKGSKAPREATKQ
jgi:hypothetical protein